MDTGPKQTRLMNPRYKANLLSVLTFGYNFTDTKLDFEYLATGCAVAMYCC